MLEIELEEPKYDTCPCCDRELTTLTRFVHKDGNAHAIYYAQFTQDHNQKEVICLIGLGEWGDEVDPSERTAFPVCIWDNEGSWAVSVTNRDESPFANVEFIGEILDRDEALQHPLIKEVFHITDHIVAEDDVILDYFHEES